jgi:hypothetical protein
VGAPEPEAVNGAMSDRVYASVFYIALIVGSSWVAVTVGEALTREALIKLSIVEPAEARPTRVETVLAAQGRAPDAAGAVKPLVPEPATLPVGILAKAMDDAERTSDPAADDAAGQDREVAKAAVPEAVKPRVAGWSKRLSKRDISTAEPETSARIIMRSLLAQM